LNNITVMSVAYNTIQGSKAICEDSSHAIKIGNTFLLHLADGHGGDIGKECAEFCITTGQKQVESYPKDYYSWTEEQWKACAVRDMDELHFSFRKKYEDLVYPGNTIPYRVDENGILWNGHSAVHGGSTYSRVLVFPIDTGFRTVVFQVGDSNVFVNGTCVSEDDSASSERHFTRIKETIPEHMRLVQVYDQSNQKYYKCLCPLIFTSDGIRDPTYTNDIWNKKHYFHASNAKFQVATYFVSQQQNYNIQTCITMGSSIGDYYAHPQGLTHHCTVKIIDTETMPHIYMATDGSTDSLNKDNQWTSRKCGNIGGVNMTEFISAYNITPIQPDIDMEIRNQRVCQMLIEHGVKVREISKELFGSLDDISEVILLP
jgi:hypothetical protein